MVIKLVLAQIQFMTVLIVASVIMLPFVVGGAVILWWEDLELVRVLDWLRFFRFPIKRGSRPAFVRSEHLKRKTFRDWRSLL